MTKSGRPFRRPLAFSLAGATQNPLSAAPDLTGRVIESFPASFCVQICGAAFRPPRHPGGLKPALRGDLPRRTALTSLSDASRSEVALVNGKVALNHHITEKESVMLHYAVVFFVIALIAALFGFGGIAAGAAGIAKILFFIFLVLFVVSLVAGLLRRGTP